MRLIDADALLKELESSELQPTKDTEKFIDGWCEGFNTVVDMINNQPTAYDTEKVKKEIDRVGKSFCDYVACNEECTSCEHHSIMNAVTGIVRNGGV